MAATGFPTLLTHLKLAGAAGALRARQSAVSGEVVTGRLADPQRALGGSLGEASLIKTSLDRIGAFRQTIDQAKARAAVTQSSLSAISRDASSLNADIAGAVARGDEMAIRLAGDMAESRLRAAVTALNGRVGEAALFSGDRVDRPAIAGADALLSDVSALFSASATAADFETALDFYFKDPAGGFQTSIYQGGAGDAPRADLGDGDIVSASARADEAAIKDLLRGLASAAVAGNAPSSAMRDEALSAAASRLRLGSDGVAEIAARIGVAEERFENRAQRLDAEETALSLAYNSLTARDPYEAASELKQIEAALEASYTITARLSNLTLTRFLAP